MKISKIVFENFKPYYGRWEIDLSVNPEKNIVLVGGRNGQGKTSFLLAAVWCLYGENIGKVDEVFKKEMRGTYPKFLKNSLNWQAHAEGKNKFSIRLVFSEVELSEGLKQDQLPATVELIRSHDVGNPVDDDEFEILIDGVKNGLISEATDKVNFVNDYLIPIDIAKFVFFDAEKIADLASLGTKEQAVVINKAFNQILGLSNYEDLVVDLEFFEKELSKRDAKGELMMQISTFEGAVNINQQKTKNHEERIEAIEAELIDKERELRDVIDQLYKRGDFSIKTNTDELKTKREKLAETLDNVKTRFHEASELIPFAIMAPLLQEANAFIAAEQQLERKGFEDEATKEKTKELAEKLFNKPPFPENEKDLDLEAKLFYYQKAKSLLAGIYKGNDDESEDLPFKHDLDRSAVQHISKALDVINTYSRDSFEIIFGDYIKVFNDFQEASAELKRIESLTQDEFIADLQNQRANLETIKSKLEQEKGAIQADLLKIESDNKLHQERIENRLQKVAVSKETERQKKVVDLYIRTLKEFIQIQKQQKKEVLQKKLLAELRKLLNKPNLINEVEINILNNNLGLEIKLYNKDKRETNPSSDLSMGEQQLYISALLKSILSESIYELPVFIDTPLGRLDQEHRDNILANYYPELAEQVIIFSTNTEIRTADMPKIEGHVARTYRLENIDNMTKISEGYFLTS